MPGTPPLVIINGLGTPRLAARLHGLAFRARDLL
jgi:hypothetical protein